MLKAATKQHKIRNRIAREAEAECWKLDLRIWMTSACTWPLRRAHSRRSRRLSCCCTASARRSPATGSTACQCTCARVRTCCRAPWRSRSRPPSRARSTSGTRSAHMRSAHYWKRMHREEAARGMFSFACVSKDCRVYELNHIIR